MWDEGCRCEDEFLPAVLQRPIVANHIAHERVTVETMDHQDHTFCGIMFDVKCTDNLPVERLEICSIAVRGALGPMTVWTTPGGYRGKARDQSAWTLVYQGDHDESYRQLVSLALPEPLCLAAGEVRGLFVHSSRPGDSSIVYDNQRYPQPEGMLLSILPGMAALDMRPFGRTGFWGEGWRDCRDFVGRIDVGVCWRLWNPECHQLFPASFRRAVRCLLLCVARPACPLHVLSDSLLLYVLNMCRWDWFGPPDDKPAPPLRRVARRHDGHWWDEELDEH